LLITELQSNAILTTSDWIGHHNVCFFLFVAISVIFDTRLMEKDPKSHWMKCYVNFSIIKTRSATISNFRHHVNKKLTTYYHHITQACTKYGPRAKCGPPKLLIWPANPQILFILLLFFDKKYPLNVLKHINFDPEYVKKKLGRNEIWVVHPWSK